MNYNKLKLFCETVQAGSFDRISEILKMHKTGVGKNIRDLEDELGVKLYKRGYGDINLTKEGNELYESSTKLFKEFKKLEKNFISLKEEELKEFVISTSGGLGANWLPFYLRSFLEKYKNIRVKIYTYLENLNLKIKDSDVIIHPYISNRKDLIQKELFSFKFFLYGNKNYIKNLGIPKNISDLKKFDIIRYKSDGITPFHRVDEFLEDKNLYSYFRREIEVNNPITELNCVMNGLSLGMIAKQWDDKEDKNLIKIFPNKFFLEEKVYLIYRHSDKENKVIDDLYSELWNTISLNLKGNT